MGNIIISLVNALACLPLSVLYVISDLILFPTIRYIVRYRRLVVEKNLALAFPEKTDVERLKIEKGFYHHLCDVFVESIKMQRMSAEELKRRFLWENIDEVMSSATEKRPFTLCYFAHYGNWEWAIGRFFPTTETTSAFIYAPLHNATIEKWVRKNRSRNGSLPIEMFAVSNILDFLTRKKQKAVIYAASDQLPKEQYVKHFHRFMGIKTKVLTGTESLITRFGMNVYYCRVVKIKRGYYACKAERLDNLIERENEEWPFTNAYYDRIQQQIREQPEIWLWSHDRWRR